MNKTIQIFLTLLFCTNTLGIFAASDQTQLADSSRVVDLDEVIVVAQPKEFLRLRQQPISSSLFDRNELQRLGINDLRQLSNYVPSFTMPQYGSRLTSSMYIRGIGSRINSPAVSLYLDGMPLISKSAFNLHTYQLERIDILRGPQGTLYGQNSEGGLLRMYSVNPLRYQGTEVRLGLATYGSRTIEVAHHQRLGQQSAFSAAAFYEGFDGFFHNTTLGVHADKRNEAGGKLRFITAFNPNWQLDWTANYQYTRENAFPYGIVTGDKTADPASNRLSNYRRNLFNTALTLSGKNKWFSLNSTTSLQYLHDFMLMDQDYLPADLMHLEQRQHQTAITEELTLKGNNISWWHWTAGAFGMYQWMKTIAPVYFHDEFNTMMGNNIRNGLINQMIPAFMQARGMTYEEAYAFLQGMVQMNQVEMSPVPGTFRTPRLNWALFHESNFDITPRLMATIGFRFDTSRESVDYLTSAAMMVDMTVMRQQVASTISTSLANRSYDTFHQFLPKLALRYTIDEAGSNVYATLSKGYRAGGFNIQMFSDVMQAELKQNTAAARTGQDVTIDHSAEDLQRIDQTIRFKPEESWNYEVGAHLNLFNGTLQADFAAFLMRIHNQQLSVLAENFGYGRSMVNAGRSRSLGIEAALRGSLLDNRLLWNANYSFTQATFRDYQDGDDNYRGHRVPFVPTHSFSLAADYQLGSLQHLTGVKSAPNVFIGADLTGQGKIYWEENNTYAQKFYMQLGAHLTATFPRFEVRLWGRNITNTHYNTFAVLSAADGTENLFAQKGNPIQFGADVGIKF